jgi:hypothetical protein
MDIQEVFYWFATIAMALSIVVLIGMVGLLFYIKKKISDLDKFSREVIAKGNNIVDEVTSKIKFVTNLKSTILGKSPK